MSFTRPITVGTVLLLALSTASAQENPGAPPPPPPPPAAPGPAPGGHPAVPAGGTTQYGRAGIIEIEGGFALQYNAVLSSQGTSSTLVFSFTPAVRYFIIDNLAIGGRMVITAAKDGPTTFQLIPEAEYNFNLGTNLFPYATAGFGYQYTRTPGVGTPRGNVTASSSNAVVEISGGITYVFGHGLIGAGLEIPITVSDPPTLGINILTRVGFFF
jgi:hypothetical protein